MVVAGVGPAFQAPEASLASLVQAGAVVLLVALVFFALLVAVRRMAG